MSEAPPSRDAGDEFPPVPSLTPKQRRILAHLRRNVRNQIYFKSRNIGDEVNLSSKEVGANMTQLQDADTDLTIEQWGFSNSTTWKITR